MSQPGYKEGYLTKRGKNFGGWKTRYFVLQGPSLEYYESVSVALMSHILPWATFVHLHACHFILRIFLLAERNLCV